VRRPGGTLRFRYNRRRFRTARAAEETPGGAVARNVAVLLDDPENRYQQLLDREARTVAARLGIHILEAEFARGSSWTQVESVNRLLRAARPDGVLMILAGEQWTRSPFERLVKAGVPVALLNRIPDWVEDLRKDHPRALVAGVTPRQEGVGEIQARQALRLAPPGAFALLVTGQASSPAATARREGFLGGVGDRLVVHEIDGRWSAAGAERALRDWFRVGADRDRPLGIVVCQNDAMAGGARAALLERAEDGNRPDVALPPLIGCDGLEQEGKAMVARRELSATVVMPATTPIALEALERYWDHAAPSGTLFVDAVSYPAVETLGSA
jgi:ABC-type sugar transport system substrate-binding protein